ncbi:MAG: quaternary ammonium compound-resistance protein SugE [Elusimicrobia bacterium]|nr:MAG: quaternary ammonium compound-resistance protein SugE [Elusimicrobiota bacterium]KAF0153741.1 MAG: quaternary ammonium compound-resistance protein SugE [Elusimicrobiota bacterium]
MTPWLYLAAAGVMEIAWAVGLKFTHGFTRLWPSVWTLGTMALSIYLLSLALRSLPIGTAYAVWTGIGAAGTAVAGMFFLGESREGIKIFCIFLILAGIVGLRVFSRS